MILGRMVRAKKVGLDLRTHRARHCMLIVLIVTQT